MINNRQNGRRRGRGSGPRTPNSAPGAGNRQDNRSRGNASQLHEKYKALARDAQLAGDRVQTEYYLQFADHYFRVLNETRARFEEQRRPRDDYMSDEDEDQDNDLAASEDGDQDDRDDRREERSREDRAPRDDRAPREQRFEREAREPRGEGREARGEGREVRSEGREPRGEGRTRRPRVRSERDEPREEVANGRTNEEASDERISLDVLPPAISVIEGGEEVARAPRRRTRRPRPEADEAEIAPAA